MHQPLFSMLEDLSVTGAKTAREMYGCGGWVAHHNTDLWRICGVVDFAAAGMWPSGGAWLAQHLWQHYLFTADKDFLKAYYPVLKGTARCLFGFPRRTSFLQVVGGGSFSVARARSGHGRLHHGQPNRVRCPTQHIAGF